MESKEIIIQAVERAKKRLQEHSNLYDQSEVAVREQIVLPLLRALSWDTENPSEVLPESTSDYTPDYTLFVDSDPVLKIDVQKGTTKLSSLIGRVQQRYSIPYLITNGNTWILVSFQADNLDSEGESCFTVWKIDLLVQPVEIIARYLMYLSPQNVIRLDKIAEHHLMIERSWQELCEHPEEIAWLFAELINEKLFYSGLTRDEIENWVVLRLYDIFAKANASTDITDVDITDVNDIRQDSPIRRGTVAEMLVEAAEEAIKEGRINRDTRIETGHVRYLINIEPCHKDGKPFWSPRRLSNGLYIETHTSKKQAEHQVELIKSHGNGR